MKDNIEKIYELEITRDVNNEILYKIVSYKRDKENIWISNFQCILQTKNKYELKIKLDLLGLSLSYLTSNDYHNTDSVKPIKSVKQFKLKSSYEN